MLMAEEEDGSSLWIEEEKDDVWIDWDELNGILSEDSNPCENTSVVVQKHPEDLSCNNSWNGGVVPSEFTHCSRSELQNGIRESESVPQREDVIPESSGWSCSENMVLSDSRAGMEAGQMFGSSETFGMTSDRKVNSVSHINSPLGTCSLSPTDWSTMSCVEHDTCSSRARDGGATIPSYDFDGSIFHAPNGSTTFNLACREFSGCIDNANLADMTIENELNLMRTEDSHSKCASHFTAMEESGIAFGSPSAVYGNNMEDPGLFEGSFHTSNGEIFFMDVESSLPNPYPTEIDGNQVSPMHCEDGGIHMEQSCYDGSGTITDYSTCTNTHNFLPHYVGLPFTESNEGNIGCTEGKVGNQVYLSRSTCKNSKFNLEAEESISGKFVSHSASVINFSNESMKYEASPHCSLTRIESSGDADGTSSSDSSRKPVPGSQSFMPRKKEMICIEDDQRDGLSEFNSASYGSFVAVHKAVEGRGSFGRSSCRLEDGPWNDEASNYFMPDTRSMISTKRREVVVKDEIKNEANLHRNMNSHHAKVNGVAKGNNSFYRSTVDDDADICILEDISVPRNTQAMRSQGESLVTSLRPVNDNLYHIGMGGARLKAIDERITYRVALQDLSQPKTESTPPEGVLTVPLLRHQRIALAWMIQKETASVHCSGGILADDQGLGKTISTIALILSEKPTISKVGSVAVKQNEPKSFNLDDEDDSGVLHLSGLKQESDSGQNVMNKNPPNDDSSFKLLKGRPAAGTLVVCPTSVLRQWADELQNKVSKEANISVLVYHGSNRTKDPYELAKYDVVLTTYSIVSMEVPKQPLVDKDDDEKGLDDPGSLEFSNKKRKYPPSGDKKSRKNKKGIDVALLESIARPLARVGWFRVVLDEAQSIKNHRTQVARACWGLRAKRRWCLSGTPVQNAIDDLYSYFRFLRYDPYAAYKSFCSMIKVPISRNPTNGYKKLQAVLKTIMLRRTKGTLLDGEPIINLPPKSIELKRVDFSEEERDFYSKLEADSQAQFRVYAEAGTVKQNYVNILLMLLRLRQACDHPLLVKGYDSSSVWRSSLETAKKLEREKQAQLLNCLEACSEICGVCNDPPEDAVVTICGHIFCNQCILEYLTGDESICPAAQCKVHLSITSVFSRETLRSSLFDQLKHDSSASLTVEPCSQIPSDSSKIKAALKVLESLSKPEVSNSKDPADSSHVSNHVNTEICMNGSRVKVSEKAIVFSQWTRMLDILESHLKDSSIQYRRLDGTMSVLARDKAVKDFNTLPEVTVMIMSLKAASLGLNMVAACHVILLDLWWNPTTEDQAIDRAHRIGQTRPVTVLRLTVKDTVEDRILALQQKKREMVASAFGEDETGGRQSRLTVDDLKYLFMA